MRLLVAIVCLSAWLSTATRAEVVTLSPIRDNTLYEDAGGEVSNGSGPALFAGRNGQGLTRRALLMFDVAGALPPSAAIDSVVLALKVSNAPNALPREFTLHRVLRDWGEGSSYALGGTGALATDQDATWLEAFHSGEPWSTPGGDFEAAPSATLTLTDLGTYVWRGAGLLADIQAWQSQPVTNHGWLVRGEESGLNTARRFDSRESAEPASGPALTIYYTTLARLHPVAWGTIKARYRRGEP
jgi:hypothetical protein